MAIQSLTNLYPGINPHLNSLLQTPGTEQQPSLFPTFHATHINHIADVLNEQLPSNYTAYPEQSLQVRGVEWGGQVVVSRPEPDVSIFQKSSSTTIIQGAARVLPTWEAAIADVIEPVRHPNAVIIRETRLQTTLGRIVARIELLSPSNKTSVSYDEKRVEAIENGTPLIEIDYLHETPSPIPQLPTYPGHDKAYPCYVAVSDPRPTWEDGRIKAYGFHFEMPAATFPIPLMGEEEILFDLNEAYTRTFTSRRFGNLVDYALEPERMDMYSASDQQRIRRRMGEIARMQGMQN